MAMSVVSPRSEAFAPGRENLREDLFTKVRHAIPAFEWPVFAADIDAILTLKKTRNAVILAHNYQTPEIYHCVADLVGDLLALAREATKVEADVIVLAGVHFMAETAKLLNPDKKVLIPDRAAGCSLAEFDHARRRQEPAPALSRRADRDLCEHVGGGEGRVRHLLHLGQCPQGRRIARRAAGDHDPGRISRAQYRRRDRRRDHHLGRPLRSA